MIKEVPSDKEKSSKEESLHNTLTNPSGVSRKSVAPNFSAE
jgi:hypothetical protein